MAYRLIRIAFGTAAVSFMTLGLVGVVVFRDTHEEPPRAEFERPVVPDERRVQRNRAPGPLTEIFSESDAARRSELWSAWFQNDPGTAAKALERLSASETSNPVKWHLLMSQLVASWILTDEKGALEWMKSLPDDGGRMKVEVQASYRWTETDPEAAASYAFSRNNPALHEAVIGKWAELDPGAAMSWAVEFAKQRPESGAISQAAAIWAQSDPKAAASFAETLQELEARRRAHVSIVTSWAMTDPEASFEWAETIVDVESREAATERAAEAWIRSDPLAARQRIETSSLPAPVKYRFMAMGFP